MLLAVLVPTGVSRGHRAAIGEAGIMGKGCSLSSSNRVMKLFHHSVAGGQKKQTKTQRQLSRTYSRCSLDVDSSLANLGPLSDAEHFMCCFVF